MTVLNKKSNIMKKFFTNGWATTLLACVILCVVVVCNYWPTVNSDPSKNEGIENVFTISEQLSSLPQDSVMLYALPNVFFVPSLEMGIGEQATSFHAYTDLEGTLDASISATPTEFAEYFIKCFNYQKTDQVLITAVDINKENQLRWHIRLHVKK